MYIRNDSNKNVIISYEKVNNPLPDELDQYQNISDVEYQIYRDQYIAQTFQPTLNTLTRIKVLIKKTIEVDLPDLFVQIENNYRENIGFSSLKSSDLTDEYTWYEFDFEPDISINVGEIYSIILYSYCHDITECYTVSCSIYNEYNRGSFLISPNGVSWYLEDDVDLCFETYGFESEPPENNPPNKPIITGETNGKTGEIYDYTISSIDPDGDDVYFEIEWFVGCPGVSWDGPYKSGEEIIKSNSWDEEGTHIITVRVKDIHGLEGESTALEVTMPKIKTYNSIPRILVWLFERFPFLQSYFSNFF